MKVITRLYLVWPADVGSNEGVVAAKASPLRNAVRIVLHLVDAIFFIGFLRPLWNDEYSTFADTWTKTLVFVKQDNLEIEDTPRRATSGFC